MHFVDKMFCLQINVLFADTFCLETNDRIVKHSTVMSGALDKSHDKWMLLSLNELTCPQTTFCHWDVLAQ